MTSIYIQGIAVCSPEDSLGNNLGIQVSSLDTSVIPVALRRRSSMSTRLAIHAGLNACEMATVDPSTIPTLFASVGGEILITDRLCLELTNPVVHISPTQFHNSVHNTAAAYWSIITGCQQASTAMAAGEQTIAMVMIEAWSWLTTHGGNLLVVCYEENWPEYIDPGMGQHAIAFAMLLSAEIDTRTIAQCSDLRVVDHQVPIDPRLQNIIDRVPVIALTPLFQVLAESGCHNTVPLSYQTPYWAIDIAVAESQDSIQYNGCA